MPLEFEFTTAPAVLAVFGLVALGMAVLLGAAVSDGLLAPVTPAMVAVVVAMIVVIRPLSSSLALWGFSGGRWITSFFGIRGVGSLFYLAYDTVKVDFAPAEGGPEPDPEAEADPVG